MKCIRLFQHLAGNLQKTCSAKEKLKKTPNTQRQNSNDEKKIKITKENTEFNKTSNQIKEIENNLRISIKTEINLREARAIAAIKEKTKTLTN